MSEPVRVGIFGSNGHQIHQQLAGHPRARLVATAAFPRANLPEALRDDAGIRHHDGLDALLADPAVELVALCSPRRRDQAADALRCLRAGRHVYAEKPCAMREADLDALLAEAASRRLVFREMASSAFISPYRAMHAAIAAGAIGEVIQVFAQTSYPWHDGRPDGEDIDGGLFLQVGIHAARLVEHVTGQRIAEATGQSSMHGCPRPGALAMASTVQFRLANGAIGVLLSNYANQPGFGSWGNYHLRVWGTRGMVESVDDGARSRLVVGAEDRGALPPGPPDVDWLAGVCDLVRGGPGLPIDVATELSPLRALLRARGCAG